MFDVAVNWVFNRDNALLLSNKLGQRRASTMNFPFGANPFREKEYAFDATRADVKRSVVSLKAIL